MFLLDGKQLRPGRPFTGTDGTQYPANWLQFASLAEKEAIGITEVADPAPYDSRFYFGRDADDNLIPRQFGDIGPDPVSGIVTTGLQTQWKKHQDQTAYSFLAPNDWYITRNAETGASIPVGITSFRTEVRSVCAERQDMITATTSTPQLADLVTGVGTAVVGYTTTMLPEWPRLEDYN
jgi:hypothetical protein